MQKKHDIERIYQEILEWHRTHDDNGDEGGGGGTINITTIHPSHSASPRDEEWNRAMSVARRQRAGVPKREPSMAHIPPRQVVQESTTDSTTTATISCGGDPVTPTPTDIDVPVPTSRPGSLKGSLKEKMTKARRSSVSSLKSLFESGNKG